MFLLILLLVKIDLVVKKGLSKKNLIWVLGSDSGKIVLILLIKVLAFYIRFTIIHVQGLGFKRFILRFFRHSWSSSF